MSAQRSISPWWALILLPVAMIAARLLGGVGTTPSVNDASLRTLDAPVSADSTHGPVRWRTFTQALRESRHTGLPMLLDFDADTCTDCQAMKRDVFESPAHAPSVMAVVLPVELVAGHPRRGKRAADMAQLREKFQVGAFPTLVVLAPATGKAAKQEGYADADQTEAWILRAAQAVREN